MFNVFDVSVKRKEADMGMLAKWSLGGKALAVMSWAADVARSIDPAAVLKIAFKVLAIQTEHASKPGSERLSILLLWAREELNISDDAAILIGYVNSIVALLKAVQVFRK